MVVCVGIKFVVESMLQTIKPWDSDDTGHQQRMLASYQYNKKRPLYRLNDELFRKACDLYTVTTRKPKK